MSKRTRRERIKKQTAKRNYSNFAIRFGISNRTSTRRRRLRKVRRSINYWHQHDELTFSKILLRDVERLWLEIEAPEATITWEKVPKCETMPAYQKGEWNGYAHFVRYPAGEKAKAVGFKITWWGATL